jgi:hemolysin activation/secretion protein
MSEFIAPLRGFSYNKLSGNSHLLLNVELRMPVKSLMSVESSSFLNSLQLVGFTDIGTAWTGSSPFAKTNGFNTNVYGGTTNPFQATVTDFRNPFLMGYGMGARANVFGYFVKFDYAFGLENKEVKSPVTYLTLGYDF